MTLVNEGVLARGTIVRIGCLQRLWQQGRLDGQSNLVTLEREAVSGSVGAMDAAQRFMDVRVVDSRTIEITAPKRDSDAAVEDVRNDVDTTDGVVFVSYRPWLQMRVISLKLHTDEWGLKAGWRLELEEV